MGSVSLESGFALGDGIVFRDQPQDMRIYASTKCLLLPLLVEPTQNKRLSSDQNRYVFGET